jgi:hypothetical protein
MTVHAVMLTALRRAPKRVLACSVVFLACFQALHCSFCNSVTNEQLNRFAVTNEQLNRFYASV